MSNIKIVFDCPKQTNDKTWLINHINSVYGCKVEAFYLPITLSKYLLKRGFLGKVFARIVIWIQCIIVFLNSNKEDIILCWLPPMGIRFNLLSMICGNTRNIIHLTWLSPLKYNYLIKRVLENPRCKIAVNSDASIFQFESIYGIELRSKMFLVPDVYDDKHTFKMPRKKDNLYCFAGGASNRDWSLCVEIANRNPEVNFVCVAIKEHFCKEVSKIPNNMKVFFNIDKSKYYSLMNDASIVLLPLKDNNVAGLINILRSAQMGIPCLITESPSSRMYYDKSESDMLVIGKDVNTWCKEISYFLNLSEEDYLNKVLSFQNFIKNEFSPSRVANMICKIISSYNN